METLQFNNNSQNFVRTNIEYTYKVLQEDINNLKLKFPFLEVGEIGRSVLNKSIPYIKIGSGKRKVFYNGSFHANEWITTPVLMKFIQDYAYALINDSNLLGVSAAKLYEQVSLYVVPMVNPDGVDLVTGGLKNVENSYKKTEDIANDFPNILFPSGWKANINGVDLNLQFPAEWYTARNIKYEQGFNKPAPRDFPGYGPLTEPEALAVYNFTLKHNFNLVIAYHTQGKEIYWKFMNYEPNESEFIAEEFAKVSGYTVAEVPYNSSFAGYKDWFIQEYKRPGFTIEAGIGENPLPISQFDEIYKDNIGILVAGLL